MRANPDVLGYMMPGFAALVALALAGVAALLASVPAGSARGAALLLVPALCGALGLAQFARESPRASLRGFHASDDFDDLRRRALPTRAMLILLTPEAVFRHWEGEAVEQLRADVTMVPVPFLGYGGFDRVLLSRSPELAELVTSYQAHGELAPGALAELARTRPVLVELDAAAALPLFPFAKPEGLLYGVPPEPPPRSVVARAGGDRRATQAALLHRLGPAVAEPETRKQLLWIRYVEALYFAWHGSFELAREAARDGLALSPHTRELIALRRALDQPQHAPFELTPFLPSAGDIAR